MYSLRICPAFFAFVAFFLLNTLEQFSDEDGFGAGHLVSTASPKACLLTQNLDLATVKKAT